MSDFYDSYGEDSYEDDDYGAGSSNGDYYDAQDHLDPTNSECLDGSYGSGYEHSDVASDLGSCVTQTGRRENSCYSRSWEDAEGFSRGAGYFNDPSRFDDAGCSDDYDSSTGHGAPGGYGNRGGYDAGPGWNDRDNASTTTGYDDDASSAPHSTSRSAHSQTQPISDYRFLQPWGGRHGFMRSYGISPYGENAYEDSRELIDRMREAAGHGVSPFRLQGSSDPGNRQGTSRGATTSAQGIGGWSQGGGGALGSHGRHRAEQYGDGRRYSSMPSPSFAYRGGYPRPAVPQSGGPYVAEYGARRAAPWHEGGYQSHASRARASVYGNTTHQGYGAPSRGYPSQPAPISAYGSNTTGPRTGRGEHGYPVPDPPVVHRYRAWR